MPSVFNHTDYVVHSRKNRYGKWDPNAKTKIKAAVQLPSDRKSELIILNTSGELYVLDMDRDEKSSESIVKSTTPALGTAKRQPPMGAVTLATPDKGHILYAFWIEGKRMFLKARMGGGPWESIPITSPSG